jgi:HTH-type transcriptional regulator/antitoxin HipB
MSERRSWSEKRADIMSAPGAGAAYDAARVRFELGEAVRHRREELGITQAELAERAGLREASRTRLRAGTRRAWLVLPGRDMLVQWAKRNSAGRT